MSHKCTCMFVPPQVLANLAKKGISDARVSIHQSTASRINRVEKKVSLAKVAGLSLSDEKPGTGARSVYDCQQMWSQRVKLVRSEGDGDSSDPAVNEVYNYAGTVRDYFYHLGRNSIDNHGLSIILNVHYGKNYMNAFWDGDEMTFGDGDGNLFGSFSRSLDVVAHELAHGVTQFTANLNYFSQSGALNEHFSDVFGTVITQIREGQTADNADWLIGDEIMGPELYGEALRSMKEPGTAYDNKLLGKDIQPSHMRYYYKGQDDNQGVHINSGIPNKAFYLTAMDIGTENAGIIWYHALQNLWSNANFNDAVDVIVESSRTLVKNGTIQKGAVQKIRAAFKAVGL